MSKVGKPLLADSATVNMTRLNGPRMLVDLHKTDGVIKDVKFQAKGISYTQEIIYDWYPRPCATRSKWGHITAECDPNERKGHGIRRQLKPASVVDPQPAAVSELPKEQAEGFRPVNRRLTWRPKASVIYGDGE